MEIEKYFTPETIEIIKKAISDADGREVFFTGILNEKGIVHEVKIGSRGNEHSVPVNFSDLQSADVLIHNHPSGFLNPSEEDIGVASNASYNGAGFYIINNNVTDVYVVVEPVQKRKSVFIEKENAVQMISDGGSLSKLSEHFSQRQGQIELLSGIVQAFNNNNIAAFEAGTGVGKSYAYLIPAALWAINNHEKVIISTGTINLQQQLCEKDIPAVQKIIGKGFKFCLLKGRQNYVCLRRLNDSASVLDLFEDETADIKKIAEWADVSETGSKSELPFNIKENVWSKINSESDACMGMKCPYHSDCFIVRSRKEAAGSNLIVVNHHLLFADIESRMEGSGYNDSAVLPPYRKVVFDEAHGIENAATSFFSNSINKFKIMKFLNQMYRKRKTSQTGHLCSLAILSANEEYAADAYELVSKIKNLIQTSETLARDLLISEYTKRLFIESARDFGPLLVSLGQLAELIGQFNGIVRKVMEGVDEEDHDVPYYWESKVILRHLEDTVLLLKNFCQWDEKKEYVFWIQKKRLPSGIYSEEEDREYIVYTQTPLDISSMMNEGVFSEMSTVVCTSATLKTGRDFAYWMRRTGVNFVPDERVLLGDFKSPFNYEKNMLFAIPSDAPLPDSPSFQFYVENAVVKLIEAAQGRTLVLFTSYDMLRNVYSRVSIKLKHFQGRLMYQGQEDNARLLESFKNENESVLFATDSFWQGVDIPGESLSQVIIAKLPFTVPNDPVFVARSEAIKNRGGNSFMELSVPEAVMKFRQGVGRLIRREDDKGVVVVLDRRLVEKKYGSLFMASIPECKKLYEPLDTLYSAINNFIFG